MKQLKFAEPLPGLILDGKKDTTWRINDDKCLEKDDVISLCTTQEKEFAQAKIQCVKKTRFKDLTLQDKQGHEKFTSEKEMYQMYSDYYSLNVIPNTKVKVIKFKLVS